MRTRRLRKYLEDSEQEEEAVVASDDEEDDTPDMDVVVDMDETPSHPAQSAPPSSLLHDVQKQLDAIKTSLLAQIEEASFPLNPLDELIDRLGGESCVAEMTGRTHRILHHHPGVPDSSTHIQLKGEDAVGDDRLNEDYYYYESRGVKRGSEEGANMIEKDLFQSGVKRVAVISEAASAGISLHSDRRVKNQSKRVHIILELPWSADKMIQQCGRSHRSNQRVPPDYVFLLSPIGGEIRFVSTLSKRLRALGALTQGSRKATGALQFDQFDFDSSYGKKAVNLLVKTVFAVQEAEAHLPLSPDAYAPGAYEWWWRRGLRSRDALPEMDAEERRQFEEYKAGSATQRLLLMKSWLSDIGFQPEKGDSTVLFFNRLLGLPLYQQTLFVRYLNDVPVRWTSNP